MSQQSRAQRRRDDRGTSHAPPPRDPMRAIYLGFAVVVVLVFIGFGLFRWHETQRIAAIYATPTPLASVAPGAKPQPAPIQLVDGQTLGQKLFPDGDTAIGGRGLPVDGIKCDSAPEPIVLHVHEHLALFVNGKQIAIPQYVGFVPNPNNPQAGCLYWIHTHDAEGIIHVESPHVRLFHLGDFFALWGQPLRANDVAGFKGPVTIWLNGTRYTGNAKQIPLVAHQQIVIDVGKSLPPPLYTFPPGD
ncbi:MAG: hypothetical protein HKL91_09365 [Candidatus Eremiobacteraeota bacterium]|uniref:Uncharacterized protein n=1 Tax=mine drainage metagenome TaxID=410659 RepID=E6PIQ9_9ZZZZ|nr:hypothetical protein [Candidatus Eremiobacteraeota bacterium]